MNLLNQLLSQKNLLSQLLSQMNLLSQLLRQLSKRPHLPANGTNFTTCLPDVDPFSDDPDDGYFAYAIALHEAGHALGLSSFSYKELVLSQDQPYEVAHATIPDTVMNYDDESEFLYDASLENPATPQLEGVLRYEPDCYPYPLDVKAMYAIYQTAVPVVSIIGDRERLELTVLRLWASVSYGVPPYHYQWTDLSGLITFASNPNSNSVFMTLPEVDFQTVVTLELLVIDQKGTEVREQTMITINP